MESKTLQDRLAVIQHELRVPKSQRNSFGNYNYRSCEDILEAVKPLLNGLTLVISDDIVNIGERYYVKAIASVSDGTNKIEATAFAREAEQKKGMDEAQITGSASSYSRKYALNGLFLIDDTKDADTMDNRHAQPATYTPKTQTTTQETPVDESGGYCEAHEVQMTHVNKNGRDIWYHRNKEGEFCNGEGYKAPQQKAA